MKATGPAHHGVAFESQLLGAIAAWKGWGCVGGGGKDYLLKPGVSCRSGASSPPVHLLSASM